jgi:hypothetical protein
MKHAIWSLAVLTVVFAPLPADAQRYEDDVTVARVAFVGGAVSYQRGDLDGWNDLRINTPLMTGDSIYAPEDGRAEVELGHGAVVRLDGGTQLDLLNNSDDVTQLGIDEGVLDLRTRGTSRNDTIEIDTPSAAATILERGHYVVYVNDETATYSVIRGSLSVAVDGQQLDVFEGESLELENTDPPSYAYTRIESGTPFQDWCDRRASRYERSSSVRYVNEQVVGCEDLDEHGSWRDVNEYGRVWVPAGVGPGWAPYQTGRWIWQDPFGWTWVSYEPWGWAPYHYGRWAYVNNFWAWVPPPPPGYRGPAVVMSIQPRYAPALVAFVGGRNWGVSVSIGGPAIGWVPLAPAEHYYYPWQAPTRVVNNYRNITVINAVTVVNYNTFATEPVRPIRVAPAQIRQAPVLGPTVAVAPTRQSLVPSGAPGGAAPAPRARTERQLVARLVPPPKPKPFDQKVTEIERTGKPVAAPVAKPPAVGKPFTPEAPAPADTRVRSFSPPRGGQARRELQARPGAAARPPKPIERDIKPPPAKGQRTPVTTQPGAESPGNRRPTRPEPQAAPQAPERPAAGQAPPRETSPRENPPREAPPRETQPPEARPPEVEHPQPRPPEARRPDSPRPPEAQPPEPRPTPGPPSDRTAPQRGNPKNHPNDQTPRSQAQPPPPPSNAPSDRPKSAGPMPKRTPKEQDAPKPAEAAPERPPSDQPQPAPKPAPEPKGKKKPKPKEKAKETDDQGSKPPEPPPENQN